MKWVMAGGKSIDIKDMKTSHIENCIAMLNRNGCDRVSISGGGGSVESDFYYEEDEFDLYEEYYELHQELNKRKGKNND